MNIKAGDIMSDHVVVIRPDTLVSEVAHLMLRDRVSGFPVIDGEGKIVGIITMTDLFVLLDNTFRNATRQESESHINVIKDQKVAEIMSRQVVTITSLTCLSEIIPLVVEQNIHCFPVVEEGRIVGILSRHDILNAVFSLGTGWKSR